MVLWTSISQTAAVKLKSKYQKKKKKTEIKILLIPFSTTNIYYFQGNICLQEGLKAKKKD
jgi:hypothetical protein